MRVVGVTGLIGAGKSIVLDTFSALFSCPVYKSDERAKQVYFHPNIRRKVQETLGIDPITDKGLLDKESLKQLLREPESKARLEQIVHQGVREDFYRWRDGQCGAEAVLLEAAILFTSGFHQLCDVTVVVQADQEVRKTRVLARPNGSLEYFEQMERLQREEAILQKNKGDYFIENSGERSLILQVEELYPKLITE